MLSPAAWLLLSSERVENRRLDSNTCRINCSGARYERVENRRLDSNACRINCSVA
jgi:hypothetical protein